MAITLSRHTQDFHDTSSEIRLDTPQDVRYWTDRLEASVSQIRFAVAAVGTSAANVEAWLRESRTCGVVRQDGKWTFLQSTVRNLMFFATGLCGGVLLS
ncbi:MAG TPA: DUF3606 domain-containing protein [Pseudoxanthomonas sp.]|nr:DUF3606 domain-containing protein [Pseudoxanthomonas sp.]